MVMVGTCHDHGAHMVMTWVMVHVSVLWCTCQGYGARVRVMVHVSRLWCTVMVHVSRLWCTCHGYGARAPGYGACVRVSWLWCTCHS